MTPAPRKSFWQIVQPFVWPLLTFFGGLAIDQVNTNNKLNAISEKIGDFKDGLKEQKQRIDQDEITINTLNTRVTVIEAKNTATLAKQ